VSTMWNWPKSKITRVVDGDTVDALLTRDIGFNGTVTFPVRLRLAGVNAPAGSTDRGRAATEWLRSELEGKTVDLVTLKPYKYGGPADATGEYMARITATDGDDVAAVMVQRGHAVAWDGRGARPADG
jgi:endonuclease YncB( thermonuclease family)